MDALPTDKSFGSVDLIEDFNRLVVEVQTAVNEDLTWFMSGDDYVTSMEKKRVFEWDQAADCRKWTLSDCDPTQRSYALTSNQNMEPK